MAGSPLDAAREIERAMNGAATAVRRAIDDVLSNAVAVSRVELNATALLGPGGDRYYSGFGPRSRLRLKVRKEVGSVLISPVGHWSVAEEGVEPHALRHGRHPGTRSTQAKRSWTRGRDAALDKLERSAPGKILDAGEEGFTHG